MVESIGRCIVALLIVLTSMQAEAAPVSESQSVCSQAMAPVVIDGTTSPSLWQIPRADRLALEEIIRSGELARWNKLVPEAIQETVNGKYRFVKLSHPKNQVSLVINMHHYVLPLVVAPDGTISHATTGEEVPSPYARGDTVVERLARWLSIPQNMTRVKKGAAIAAVAGVGALAVYAYTMYRDVDWYDDDLRARTPATSVIP